MSEALVINGKTYEKIRQAAEVFDYSADYITRLARSKKIAAVQQGKLWYVSLDSLGEYAISQRLEQQVRQSQLRTHRQQELTLRTAVANTAQVIESKYAQGHSPAVAVAMLLVCIGVSFGFFFLYAPDQSIGLQAMALTAADVADSSGQSVVDVQDQAPSILEPQFVADTGEVRVTDDRHVRRPAVTENWLVVSYE